MATTYDVTITRLNNGQSTLQIARDGTSSPLFHWSGEVARRVIAWSGLRHGQSIDKHRVCELAVTAAAVGRSASIEPTGIVENIVQQRAGEHLLEDDLVSLCLAECPTVAESDARAALRGLARAKKIQRIVIDSAHVFYDADTRAHLHVFDPVSGRLFDAPESGVIVGQTG